jgi:hypothetical protein
MLFSIEWQVFTYLIACLVDARRHIDMIIDYYLRKLKSRKLPLEQVTTPASSQTVEENGSECPICLREFTPKDCPIQTKCEHVFGKQCLKQWAKRKDSCPFCRALKCSRMLDVEVDQYLLAGLETPTNHIFGELLASLTDSYNKWMLAYMAMDEEAQKYKPFYVQLRKACFRRMNGVWGSLRRNDAGDAVSGSAIFFSQRI